MDKVIFIIRNPKDAYLSRICMKHFLHINDYDEKYIHEILELNHSDTKINEENIDKFMKIFQTKKKEYENEGKDIMRLQNFFENWNKFSHDVKYNTLFIKYEALGDIDTNVILDNFIQPGEYVNINMDFKYKSRNIDRNDLIFLNEFEDLYNELPNFWINSYDPNKNYTVKCGAGFADFFNRYREINKIMTHYGYNFCVNKLTYKNCHNPNGIFNINKNTGFIYENKEFDNNNIIMINSTNLCDNLITNEGYFNTIPNNIVINLNECYIATYKSLIELQKKIFTDDCLLHSTAKSTDNKIYIVPDNSITVLFHFRRGDMIQCKNKIYYSIRPLGTFNDFLNYLLDNYPNYNIYNIVICSDGFIYQQNYTDNFKEILENSIFNFEPKEGNFKFNNKNINIIDKIIGKNNENDEKIFNIIKNINLIITCSCGFIGSLIKLYRHHCALWLPEEYISIKSNNDI